MITDEDIDELEIIGQWLNERYPGWRDRTANTDGDRVLAAVEVLRSMKTKMELVETLLRSMYRSQRNIDEDGRSEVAAWYYLTDLEHALGVKLDEEDDDGS